MKPAVQAGQPEELELKLALPAADASDIARALAHTPALARRKATREQLYSIYYDTAQHHLRAQRIALRLRRVQGEHGPYWQQTLKTADAGGSALSRRGEWETTVPGQALTIDALRSTPWPALDPDGTLFDALVPCFVTRFERTRWSVRRRDGSVIEVALDLGQITTADKSAPICELELELKAGQPTALFELAQQIAGSVAVLPLASSKAERGYALAMPRLETALRAAPARLDDVFTVPAAAQCVLREMFFQFTTNLHTLLGSDDVEVAHQARVGWRRFKSGLRLFRPVLAAHAAPSWQALLPMLDALGELRDIDVALNDTLPPLAAAYTASDARRSQAWEALMQNLRENASLRRAAVRESLQTPAVGAALLATTQWLEALSIPAGQNEAGPKARAQLRRWARQRIAHLRRQLKTASRHAQDAQGQHRMRIMAKRLRYASEALGDLLPAKRTRHMHDQALDLQNRLGAARDLMQASVMAARLQTDCGLAEFLRGVAVERARRP